jgi:hypothetical protein
MDFFAYWFFADATIITHSCYSMLVSILALGVRVID